MITSVLDLSRADRSYVLDSMKNPPFLAKHWQNMIEDMEAIKDLSLNSRDPNKALESSV
jgi:hypothetical protein